jgi:hypothetical protein
MSDRPTSGPAPRWGEYAPVAAPVAPPEVERAPEPEVRKPETHKPVSLRDSLRGTAKSTDSAESVDGPARPVRRWDRILTSALLALAVLNVLTGIPAMLDLPETLSTYYRTFGMGSYTSVALASGVGIAINVSQVVLLIVTVLLTTASLRAHRISFWIPLTAGVISTILISVLFSVAMSGDPALGAYLDR